MKKATYIIAALFLMVGSINMNAQMEMSQQDCTVEYNLYKGDVQSKNFTEAKTRLDNLMENCPDLSVNIYKLGEKIVDNMIENGDLKGGVLLISEIYDQRIKYYPNDAATVYDAWVSFLVKNGLQEDERVYQFLENAYKEDPTKMSPKNIYMYFDLVLERNKNIDVQKILDTYDDINDAFETQSGIYQQRLSKLIAKEEAGASLNEKDARSKRIAEGRLKNIGIIEGGLEQKIEELLTCDRLVPLYRRDFNANKENAKWLQRAVSRMFRKDCTEDPLYEELAYAYAEADPSSNSYVFLSRILEKNGKKTEALEMRKKAIDLEIDPIRKSRYLYDIALGLSKKGRKSEARKYANDAIKNNPSNGSAYLLIASMYASSANNCGTDVFTKRMVYVAALNKARRALKVDPSITSRAKSNIKVYTANLPTKEMIFAEGIKEGDPYKISCWIGENVKVEVR